MTIKEFEELTEKAKMNHPKMFGLDSDIKATMEDIKSIEEYYDIVFPESYNEFLLRYGGGYFAYTVVYSLDAKSPFYIKKNVLIEFVQTNKFFPVIDFETGDIAGFRIVNGMCEDSMVLYDHEEKVISDLNMSFYEILVKHGLQLA